MNHTVIYGLPGFIIFFHILINGTTFGGGGGGVIEHEMRDLIFPKIWSETFLILRRTERDVIKNVHWSSSKVPDILIRF
jgi:hypothetical protein